jgi:hypothetical protein
VRVAADAHGAGLAARVMKVEHRAQIRLGHEIPVHHDEGIAGRLGQQRQGAAGAERFGFAQIVDVAAERAAVTEVILDHVAQIVDGQGDAADAEAHQVQDDPFEDRAARHGQHRLGQAFGQREQTRATATGHHHGAVGAQRDADQIAHQVQADQLAVIVDDRDLAQIARLHHLQHFGAPDVGAHRDELRSQMRRKRRVDRDAAQDDPAHVAVGEQAAQAVVLVDHQGDQERAAFERPQDIQQARVVAHGGGVKPGLHV